jgi:hypothetical protein
MYDLEKVFKDLTVILDQNLMSENKDFWGVYYGFWRYLYSINQNIEECTDRKAKIDVIENFISKYKDIQQIEKALLERNKINEKEEVGSSEDIPFNPHIQEMKALLIKEQERLGRLMREVKKDKISIKTPSGKGKKGLKKEKWLKS